MNSGTKRILNFAIGIILAALLIWLFFKDADWSAVGQAIAEADVWLLVTGFLFQIGGVFIKSWRWKLLLAPIKEGISVHSCWKYFNIGFACTSLIPGRIGEVLRPYLLAKEEEIKFTSTFATIFTERVIDLVVILAMFSTIFMFPSVVGPNPDAPGIDLLKTAGLGVLAVSALAIIFLVIIKVRTEWAVNIVRFLTKPLPEKISNGLISLVESFAEGVGGIKGPVAIFNLVISSLLGWGGGVVFFWFVFKAFGMDAPLHHFIFLQAVAALGVIIPTPAGSGGYHGAIILIGASLWGFGQTGVQALAIVSHLIIFGSMTLIGVLYLITGGINIFKSVEKAKEDQQEEKSE